MISDILDPTPRQLQRCTEDYDEAEEELAGKDDDAGAGSPDPPDSAASGSQSTLECGPGEEDESPKSSGVVSPGS